MVNMDSVVNRAYFCTVSLNYCMKEFNVNVAGACFKKLSGNNYIQERAPVETLSKYIKLGEEC